jgi:chromosome transmission fidelity protein 4
MMQKAFQPSSTPIRHQRCFLCWNTTGTITSFYKDEQNINVIELEFHDQNVGRSLHFNDHFGFRLASLTTRGAFFASRRIKDSPAKLFFKAIESWGSNADWMLPLPADEDTIVLAMGNTWVAVATTKQFLRLFSYDGLQLGILSLTGSLVTIAGQNHLLAIVYHMGLPMNSFQNLGCVLLNLETKRVLFRDKMPISASSKLRWLGFSEAGTLYSFDSRGILRALIKSLDFQWVPMLNIHEEAKGRKADLLWIVGVTDNELLCVPCKPDEEYPSVVPRPLTITLPLRMPLLYADQTTGDLEECYLRKQIFMNESYDDDTITIENGKGLQQRKHTEWSKAQAELDTFLIKLIQIACSQDKTSRVLGIATLLQLPKSFDIAIKVASHHHLVHVAEKIQELKGIRTYQAKKQQEITKSKIIEPYHSHQHIAQELSQSISSQSQFSETIGTTNNLLAAFAGTKEDWQTSDTMYDNSFNTAQNHSVKPDAASISTSILSEERR